MSNNEDPNYDWAIDLVYNHGDKLISKLLSLRSQVETLTRRLYPGQGEEYTNEVERQRVVIEELTHISNGYRNSSFAAHEQIAKLETALRDLLKKIEEEEMWLEEPENRARALLGDES